jgi:hypothetical protein
MLKFLSATAIALHLAAPAFAFDVPDPGEGVCVVGCGDNSGSDRDYDVSPITPSIDYRQKHAYDLNGAGLDLYRQGDISGAIEKFWAAAHLYPGDAVFESNARQVEVDLILQEHGDDWDSLILALKKLDAARPFAERAYQQNAHRQGGLGTNSMSRFRWRISRVTQKLRTKIQTNRAWYIQQEHQYEARLNQLHDHSISVMEGFNALADEAQREHDEVIHKAIEQSANAIGGEVIDRIMDGVIDKQVNALTEKALDVKDVRSGRLKGILRNMVDEIRDEIKAATKGQTAAEAKETAREIVLKRINANADALLSVAKTTGEHALDYAVKNTFDTHCDDQDQRCPLVTWGPDPADKEPIPKSTMARLASEAEKIYPDFLQLVQVAKAHGVDGLNTIDKKIPVLMLVPDGIEWAATFCRLVLDRRGQEALDQMQATTLQSLKWIKEGDPGRNIPGLKDLMEDVRRADRDLATLDKWDRI